MRGRDQRITVQWFRQSGVNALNEPVGVWMTHCDIWAARRDQDDVEVQGAGATGSATTAQFVVRDNSLTRGIQPAMRIWDGVRAWNIKKVMQRVHNGRRDLITLYAVTDSAAGAA